MTAAPGPDEVVIQSGVITDMSAVPRIETAAGYFRVVPLDGPPHLAYPHAYNSGTIICRWQARPEDRCVVIPPYAELSATICPACLTKAGLT